MKARYSSERMGGFTLIEMIVVVAIVVIVLTLSVPSFRRFTDAQRVSSINATLVTDLQFARAEAAARGERVRMTFRTNAALTCYTIYTYSSNGSACDCRQPTPCAAAGAGFTEIRTNRIPYDHGVYVYPGQSTLEFAFEPLSGGLYTIPKDVAWVPLQSFTVRTFIDAARELRTVVGQSGRPIVCAPPGSQMRESAC